MKPLATSMLKHKHNARAKEGNLLHGVRDESTIEYGDDEGEVYILCRTIEMPEVETKGESALGRQKHCHTKHKQ